MHVSLVKTILYSGCKTGGDLKYTNKKPTLSRNEEQCKDGCTIDMVTSVICLLFEDLVPRIKQCTKMSKICPRNVGD